MSEKMSIETLCDNFMTSMYDLVVDQDLILSHDQKKMMEEVRKQMKTLLGCSDAME